MDGSGMGSMNTWPVVEGTRQGKRPFWCTLPLGLNDRSVGDGKTSRRA